MERVLHYEIDRSGSGLPIGIFLRRQGYSRHVLTQIKSSGPNILLNGCPVYTNQPLREGDRLTVRIPETEGSGSILPRPVPFSILYEDEDILAVNKPAGTPVHPSPGNYENTLANGLARYFQTKQEPFVFRCVNRLDRDTTGLLLLARHALSAALLSSQMAGRRIHRTYRALALGQLPASGTIDTPLGRKPGSIIERCADPEKGETAVTHFRTLARFPGYSYLELHLETGRTHQIRVHLASIGHPLLGDSLYGPGKSPLIGRQALHSWGLDFVHPITKEAVHFAAPLPSDMQALLGPDFIPL